MPSSALTVDPVLLAVALLRFRSPSHFLCCLGDRLYVVFEEKEDFDKRKLRSLDVKQTLIASEVSQAHAALSTRPSEVSHGASRASAEAGALRSAVTAMANAQERGRTAQPPPSQCSAVLAVWSPLTAAWVHHTSLTDAVVL